jgi:hypothetical protein
MTLSRSCPVCDGRGSIEHPCPQCQVAMEDCGAIGYYYDPYAPYNENKLGFDEDMNECPHLLKCDSCDYEEEYKVKVAKPFQWDWF